MKIIRSIIFDIFFYSSTFLITLLFLPFLLLPLRYRFIVPKFWARIVLVGAKYILGLKYQVRGAENLPTRPFIVACKHQSAWETVALNIIIPESVFIFKRELLRIPIINFYLVRLKCISVKRGGRQKTIQDMLSQARQVLKEGLSIIIFPEGTRSHVGKRPHYRQGIGNMYTDLGVPVVPIALNSGLFWGRRSFLKVGGEIIVEIFKPIEPGLPREEFMQTLENTIEKTSDDLCSISKRIEKKKKWM